MRPAAYLAILAVICAHFVPLAAREPAADFAENYTELRAKDQIIQDIGWKLLTGNAQFCELSGYSTGLLVQDAAAYGDPESVRAIHKITGDMFVQTIVEGSPASRTGLKPGDQIDAIGKVSIDTLPFDPEKLWSRGDAFGAALTDILYSDGHAHLTVAGRSGDIVLGYERTCASYFEDITGSENASANGERVAIGQNFVGFAYAEDELAAALAHELAHNLVHHPNWLDKNGRQRRNIRQTEREADRLMPWILANAGYDPAAAGRFMRRWGPEHSGGLFRKRTHDGWDERVALIEAELPHVAASIAKHGAANWLIDFERQFDRS